MGKTEEKRKSGLAGRQWVAIILVIVAVVFVTFALLASSMYYLGLKNRTTFNEQTNLTLQKLDNNLSEIEQSAQRVYTTEAEELDSLNEVNFAIKISSERKFAEEVLNDFTTYAEGNNRLSGFGVGLQYEEAADIYADSLSLATLYNEDLAQFDELTQASVELESIRSAAKTTDGAYSSRDREEDIQGISATINSLKSLGYKVDAIEVSERNQLRKDLLIELVKLNVAHYEYYLAFFEEYTTIFGSQDVLRSQRLSEINSELRDKNTQFELRSNKLSLSYLDSNKVSLDQLGREVKDLQIRVEAVKSKLK